MNFKQEFPTPKEHTEGQNACKYIVLHHTGTADGTIKGVLDGLYRRADYASCHFVIDTNGDIYKIGKTTDILWHCGDSSWGEDCKNKSLNAFAIGIEIIGPTDPHGFTEAQQKSLKTLIKWLYTSYGITADRVLRHKDITQEKIGYRKSQRLRTINSRSRKVDPDNRLLLGKKYIEWRQELYV